MKKLPLFLFDLARHHSAGETDFVTCTDPKNGFIAKIRSVANAIDAGNGSTIIGKKQDGVSVKIEIVSLLGSVNSPVSQRKLMERAMDEYIERRNYTICIDAPDDAELLEFISSMIRMFKQRNDATMSVVGEKTTWDDIITIMSRLRARFVELAGLRE